MHIADTGYSFRLTGTVDTWNQVVEAGLMCAKSGSKKHIVNDITVPDLEKPCVIQPKISDAALEGRRPDVLVIGGGVVGCAIARELTKEKMEILLIDKEYDVALHASSRNDGMVHPGIDIRPGLLKKKMNNLGNALYDKVCKELDVPFVRSGQFLCLRKYPICRCSF